MIKIEVNMNSEFRINWDAHWDMTPQDALTFSKTLSVLARQGSRLEKERAKREAQKLISEIETALDVMEIPEPYSNSRSVDNGHDNNY